MRALRWRVQHSESGPESFAVTLLSGQFRTTNAILSALPQAEFDHLRPSMTHMRLVPQQRLIESGQPTEHVFFIEEGIASFAAIAGNGRPGVQVAMVGREGIVGSLALLGETAAYACVTMQVPGSALRITVADLLRNLERYPALREASHLYVQSLARQVMSTTAFNAHATLVERCVRWLLMAHDRVGEDDLLVTHEALSVMLGVRRSSISVAAATLQKARLIGTRRGCIRVLDRSGLEAIMLGAPFTPDVLGGG